MHHLRQMPWTEVSILHGHRQRGVTEYALQGKNISPSHHVVTGESMPQHVRQLACRQLQLQRVDGLAEFLVAFAKR